MLVTALGEAIEASYEGGQGQPRSRVQNTCNRIRPNVRSSSFFFFFLLLFSATAEVKSAEQGVKISARFGNAL